MTSKGDNNIDSSSKVHSTTKLGQNSRSPSPALQTLFFGSRKSSILSLSVATSKSSFPECFAFRDRFLEVFMATREQLAIALDSASGWTAVPMTSTGCYMYDTNHLFYAFPGVYTEFTQDNVLIHPRAYNYTVKFVRL